MTKDELRRLLEEPVKVMRIIPNEYDAWPGLQVRWIKLKPNGEPEKGQGLSGEESSCNNRV